ncbi:hypothetical protein E2C01_076649 [Portunus trituberculatus]|uniref:Uncharacterized protein n=1 Tax=Portunus trituberculatus TaxID=210409 RepID=A0A5B7IK87_PORTR|nr:hypothetical protein [Portunus trituberculatus]
MCATSRQVWMQGHNNDDLVEYKNVVALYDTVIFRREVFDNRASRQ